MPIKVLIAGAGIAGPAVAFWLSKHGHDCTVVERFSSLRTAGLQVDLRNEAIEVVRRMGLLPAVRARSVPELGTIIVDARGREKIVQRRLEHDYEHGVQGRTSAYEILRRDMVRILYDATKDRVRYRFGLSVDHYRNVDDDDDDDDGGEDINGEQAQPPLSRPHVRVTLSDGSVETYDLLIAADGQGSRIRKQMLLYTPEQDHSRWLGIFSAYYSLPRREYDTPFARLYHAPGRRLAMTRWHTPTTGQAYLMAMTDEERFRRALEFKGTRGGDGGSSGSRSGGTAGGGATGDHDTACQRDAFLAVFRGMGWQEERLLRALEDADDFYADEMTQRRSDVWHRGRVVLLGDAAYCASPIAGVGCSMALIGAYVLAGELALRLGGDAVVDEDEDNKKTSTNHDKITHGVDDAALDAALQAYHTTLRPLADKSQRLPKRSLQAWLPLSTWSIRGLHLREWARDKGWRLAVQPWARTVRLRDQWILPDYPEMCWRRSSTARTASTSIISSSSASVPPATTTTTSTTRKAAAAGSIVSSSSAGPPTTRTTGSVSPSATTAPTSPTHTLSSSSASQKKRQPSSDEICSSPCFSVGADDGSTPKKMSLMMMPVAAMSSVSLESEVEEGDGDDGDGVSAQWPLVSDEEDLPPLPLRPPPPPLTGRAGRRARVVEIGRG